MSPFIQGVLNVHEEPYRNELDLRLSSGKMIPIFLQPQRRDEEDDLLDTLLETGNFYELLIIVRTQEMTFTPAMPPLLSELVQQEIRFSWGEVIKRNALLQGKILDLSWNAASLGYRAVASPRIYDQRYILLETAIGNVVISQNALQEELQGSIEQVTVDGYLEWKRGRLDVLAIIEKRELKPGEHISNTRTTGESPGDA